MLYVLGIALVATLVLTPITSRLASRSGAISRPDGIRRLHAQPVPLGGGIALCLALLLGFLGSFYILPDEGRALISLALSVGILGVLGFYDDRYELRARWKLAGQILATFPVVLGGFCVERVSFLGYTLDLGPLAPVVMIGWLIFVINALNLLDGADGVASIVGIVISLGLGCLAITQGDTLMLLVALAMSGALAGFLFYNRPPARVYLGDCGSMVIGMLLSVMALRAAVNATQTVNLSVLLVFLFVPLVDTFLAIVRRTMKGQNPLAADCGHVHHRLRDAGFSDWGVIALFGIFCTITSSVAWVAVVPELELWAWGILAVAMLFAVNLHLVGHEEWAVVKQSFQHGISSWAERNTSIIPFLRRLDTSNSKHVLSIGSDELETETAHAKEESADWQPKKAA